MERQRTRNRRWWRRVRSLFMPLPTAPSGEALLDAAEEGDLRVVRALLALGTPPDEVRNRHHETALWLAAHHGHTRVAKALLKAGADPVADDGTGITPIIRAASGGFHNIINQMAKIRPEVVRTMQFQSESAAIALRRAALASEERALRALLKGGTPVDARPRGRPTALFATADSADPACMKELLKAGASPHEVDGRGRTPLHVASLGGNVKTMTLLLAVASDADALDNDGRSPLDMCANNAARRLLVPKTSRRPSADSAASEGAAEMIPLAMLGPGVMM